MRDDGIGNKESQVATVTVNITPVNDEPSASAQTVTAIENGEKLIALVGDDGDPDAVQHLTFILMSLPTTGTLSQTSGGAAIATVPFTLASPNVFFVTAPNDHSQQTFSFNADFRGA